MARMPNIANILKTEISRIARREIKSETVALKKAVASYRGEIAALKRRTLGLEQQLRQLAKNDGRGTPAGEEATSSITHRFSAKRLAAHRRRLGLSATDFGRLLGVSAQSIYNWEQGRARPFARHMPAIAALRALRKTQAIAHLKLLQEGG